MWEGYYGKEPFDLRLTALRLMRRSKWIIGWTAAGTLLFGGSYYIRNVTCAEALYRATSVYHVDYAVEEEKDVGTVYINETTWNTYVSSGFFLDAVQQRVDTGMTEEELVASIHAVLASDLRVPSTEVTTKDAQKSVAIAGAVEAVMTQQLPEMVKEAETVRVIAPAETAPLVETDARPVRAFLLGAVVSCFFAVVLMLLKELGDDAVWLPETIERRYGIKTVGTLQSGLLQENIRYLFGGMKKAALCPVQEQLDPKVICGELEACAAADAGGTQWLAVPSPVLCPESCRILREADGILLALKAGGKACRQLEYTLEYLRTQDCKITAVILCDADEWLLRCYHGFPKNRAKRRGTEAEQE